MKLTRRRLFWIVLIAIVLAVVYVRMRGPSIEPGSALVLELRGGYVEGAEPSLFARVLGDSRRTLLSLLSNVSKAERDDRLEAVVVRVGPLDVGWAKAQELRDALGRLREAGRRPIAYLELEENAANLEYYVATGADEIWIAPNATAPVVGLAAEYLFLGGLWEKLGVDVEVYRAGEYKSAVEFFAATKMSDASREMENALLDSIDAQFVSGIAERRGLAVEAVRGHVDAGLVFPAKLLEAGLVDRVAFYDELLSELGDPPVVEEDVYDAVRPGSVGFDPQATFALVFGTGPVVTGQDRIAPAGGPVLASETVAGAIEAASEDPEVEAIILRVDSPGGSALASDRVWRATRTAQERGKPVIASFSDVAASGGYYVGCAADAVLSQPGTLTGSIGVFALRPVLGGLYDKLGIGYETLTRGARADLLLSTGPLSAGSRELLRAEIAAVYDRFVERVATGRDLTAERVDGVGRGRVWTGAQAAERGLVDALGGLRAAVDRGKELAGIDPASDVALVVFPPPRTLAEQLASSLSQGAAGLASRALPVPAPLPDALRELERWLAAVEPSAPVLLPPFVARIR